MKERGASQPIVTGIVTAIVGFASSFAIVLAGLSAVGASDDQAASGLFVLCLTMGATGIYLSMRTRMPVSIAWSTPGAALLISAGAVDGGYDAAVGAFVFAGVLTVIAGLWGRFGDWIAAIPAPLASALLAGVLLTVCVAPVEAAVELPDLALPVIAVWALLMRVARRWAVPGSLVAAAVAIAIDGSLGSGATDDPLPVLAFTSPAFDLGAIIGLGIPLFIVTMASQNLTGLAVLSQYGYKPKLGPLLTTTGAASVVGAPFGGHGINLAAITAAMAAGPDAHPDPKRRWIAAASCGAFYIVFAVFAGLATALIAASPPLLIKAVAGLALIGALAGALSAAMADAELRDAATIVLLGSASGISALGLSGPFWGLIGGLAYLGLQRLRSTPAVDRRPVAHEDNAPV